MFSLSFAELKSSREDHSQTGLTFICLEYAIPQQKNVITIPSISWMVEDSHEVRELQIDTTY
jgi:hypothetical protein